MKTIEEEKETLEKEVEKLTNNFAKFTEEMATLDLMLGNQIFHRDKTGLGYVEKAE